MAPTLRRSRRARRALALALTVLVIALAVALLAWAEAVSSERAALAPQHRAGGGPGLASGISEG